MGLQWWCANGYVVLAAYRRRYEVSTMSLQSSRVYSELIAVLLVRTACRLIWCCGVAAHDMSMRTPARRRDTGKYARATSHYWSRATPPVRGCTTANYVGWNSRITSPTPLVILTHRREEVAAINSLLRNLSSCSIKPHLALYRRFFGTAAVFLIPVPIAPLLRDCS